MGQYFKAALVDNEGGIKVIQPDGWKLMEHSYYGTRTMNRIQKILYRNAYNVYWVGDYSRIGPLFWKHKFENEEELGYERELKDDEILDISSSKNIDTQFYLVNHTAYEFINMSKQYRNPGNEDGYGWIIHPLPLLCRNETEEAGGGYHSDKGREYIGAWEGHMISIYSGGDEVEAELIAKGFEDKTDIYLF